MDCSTPGVPVHHQLPELAQAHVHLVGDTSQPSHPLSSPSFPASIFPSIRVKALGKPQEKRREGWGMVPGWTEEMTASEAAGKEAWEQARRPRPLKSQSAPKRRHHPEGNRSTDWSVFMMGSWVIFFQLLYAFFYFKNSCNACDLFSWSEAEKEKEKRKKQKQIPEEYQAF